MALIGGLFIPIHGLFMVGGIEFSIGKQHTYFKLRVLIAFISLQHPLIELALILRLLVCITSIDVEIWLHTIGLRDRAARSKHQ